ncbi:MULTISPECIES: amidophosphoribosyltransferase [Methylophaga]|jgi:amidophosphoribosyltransferase|uniref:Amidophosphoribosyltransferase n=1 Tax=Methylophaga marina TaxID=45495 RepID=A0ABN0TJV0_9GAMM|nr:MULTISPECIES: amidophosphoribosyltransferase [Methylophaga]BDZ75379.1 amidophosphoribosyltransferase [Methylophaga marina]|tara:strand:+ start:874 stop:2379 length:1506 start_codon:yes stop_codon:yes gene_type:complete
MCGIIGIVGHSEVNQALYDGLTVLQHRGQDAAGIMTCDDDGKFFLRKDNGLVKDVFHTRHMIRLKGKMGIGHIRYPTAGCSTSAESQPFYVNSPFGIALAHNGNLTNTKVLKDELFQTDRRHLNTDSDSEVLLNVLAHELQNSSKLTPQPQDIFNAVAQVHRRCRGAYAAVAMISGVGVMAFRDPYGIRPAVIGKRETEQGTEYVVASESVAVDILDYELVRDIEPGECVFIDTKGNFYSQQCAENPVKSPCIFEYVYFARPDSMMDGISVHKSRMRMGTKLAQKIKREFPEHDIDVVIPIPDTSRSAALQLSYDLGVVYREGFIKNRYIGRTFIMPGQTMRKKSVRQKLNAIDLEFRGKNVLLVDDSIVRGTTSQQIVQMARDAGANKVYLASAAPPVRFPNVYGIDMPSANEFVAHDRNVEEISKQLGVDWLVYQDLPDLVAAINKKSDVERFDTSCFDGEYITGDIDANYLYYIDAMRNDLNKQNSDKSNAVIELHNN